MQYVLCHKRSFSKHDRGRRKELQPLQWVLERLKRESEFTIKGISVDEQNYLGDRISGEQKQE